MDTFANPTCAVAYAHGGGLVPGVERSAAAAILVDFPGRKYQLSIAVPTDYFASEQQRYYSAYDI